MASSAQHHATEMGRPHAWTCEHGQRAESSVRWVAPPLKSGSSPRCMLHGLLHVAVRGCTAGHCGPPESSRSSAFAVSKSCMPRRSSDSVLCLNFCGNMTCSSATGKQPALLCCNACASVQQSTACAREGCMAASQPRLFFYTIRWQFHQVFGAAHEFRELFFEFSSLDVPCATDLARTRALRLELGG